LITCCPGCNLTKAERTSATDWTGKWQPLFDPRAYEPWLLGWHVHFFLNYRTGAVLPRSPVGEATITGLNMNAPKRRFARLIQVKAGLIQRLTT
jgi:hypothetical protein